MPNANANDRRKWWVLAGATLLYLATVADGPNFNAAIPSIQEYFNASITAVQLLTGIGAMFVAAFVLAAGSFGDLFGIKRVFIIGGIGLCATLVLQALSTSMAFLTIMRGLDGLFSAVTTPLAVALIMMEFEGKQRNMAMGIFTAGIALGEIFSPVISGRLIDVIGWRASFLTSTSAAVLATFFVARSAREQKNPNATRIDWGGVALSAVAIFGLVNGFIRAGANGFSDPYVRAGLVVGALGILAFLWWETRASQPALQLSLFRKPAFATSFFVGVLMFFVYMPINPLMNAYFQNVMQYTALTAGLALIPFSLGTVISSPFVGKLTGMVGERMTIVIGLGTFAVGSLLVATMSTTSPYWIIGLGLLLAAVGYGLANPPRVAMLMSSAPNVVAGAASGANSVGEESGTAIGIALGTTFSVGLGVRAFYGVLGKAGLSPEQSQQAVAALRSAISDSMTTHNPTVSQSVLDQLIEGARQAYATGIGQTMLVNAFILILACLVAWFGMRGKRSGQDSGQEAIRKTG